MFFINQPSIISTKKLSLYIQIPKIYLGVGVGVEFGLERIKELGTVVRGKVHIIYHTGIFDINVFNHFQFGLPQNCRKL